jgi:hypothetical protein
MPARPVIGRLFVTLVNAENLPNVDIGSLTDAFVRMRVGADIKTSRRIDNDLNPQFNQELVFLVNSEDDFLDIDVLDHNRALAAKPVGGMTMNIHDLKQGNISKLVSQDLKSDACAFFKPKSECDEPDEDRKPCKITFSVQFKELDAGEEKKEALAGVCLKLEKRLYRRHLVESLKNTINNHIEDQKLELGSYAMRLKEDIFNASFDPAEDYAQVQAARKVVAPPSRLSPFGRRSCPTRRSKAEEQVEPVSCDQVHRAVERDQTSLEMETNCKCPYRFEAVYCGKIQVADRKFSLRQVLEDQRCKGLVPYCDLWQCR